MIFLDPPYFDEALLGVVEQAGHPPVALYDTEIALVILVRQGMTPDEAQEWFDFNIIGSYLGPNTPAFLFRPIQ